MSKSLGLALGSGGSRGIAHVGVLLALEEAGIRPDYIAGCSMGAVVGGLYCSGMSAHEMRDVAMGLKMRDIIDLSPLIITRMSILRTKKVEDLLLSYLGKSRIEDMQIPFRCVATDVYSGKLHVFESGDAAKAIQASSTIPTVFRPVGLGDMLLIDGGVLCRIPDRIVKDMGADVVVSVDALVNTFEPVEKVGNIFDLILRVYDIMDSAQTAMHERYDPVSDLILRPKIEGMSQYVIKELDRAFEEGYQTGRENIDKIKELLKD